MSKKPATRQPAEAQQQAFTIDQTALTQMISQATAAAIAQLQTKPGFGIQQGNAHVLLGGQQSAHQSGISWKDFCMDEDLAETVPRAYLRGVLDKNTFDDDEVLIRQLEREGVQLWPPDAESFWSWVKMHPKSKASLDNHRKAFNRVLDYHGIPIPPQLKRKWNTEKAVSKAQKEGTMKKFEQHFRNGAWDVQTLSAASPMERGPRREYANLAFRHAVALSVVGAPRGGEAFYLNMKHFDVGRQEITFWQEKKKAYRTMHIPETWFWKGVGVSYVKYATDVRQKLLAEPTDSYLLSMTGKAWGNSNSFRVNFADAIRDTLGYSIGPHAFRRFSATVKSGIGWTDQEVADFLDDEVDTVKKHYIDDTVARMIRRNVGRAKEERPPMPPLWSLPKVCGIPKPHMGPNPPLTGSAYGENS